MSQAESIDHMHQALRVDLRSVHTYPPYSFGLFFSYTIRGTGPLLIVQAPGWGIGSPYLQVGFSPLEAHFTLLYVEPRGSANVIRPEEDTMTTLQMIEDLERLRLHLGLDKINILGHSHGGIVSLGYASRYPDRVGKLILLVHALQGYDDSASWNALAEKRKEDPRYAFGYSAKTEAPPKTNEEYTDQFFKRISYCFADPVRYHKAFLKTVQNKLSLWTWDALAAGDKVAKFEQEKELESVRAKTLIIGASEDPLGSVNVSTITHMGIDDSEMVILDECGHFPWIEQEEKFFAAVFRFLGRD